jgi:hypothetical protein
MEGTVLTTLLPRSAYDMTPHYWRRLRGVFGLMYGVPMSVFIVASDRSHWLFGLALGLLAGVLFGMLMVWWVRRAARSAVDRIYSGDPAIVADPPGSPDYTARLPCGLQLTARRMVPGVLFISCGDLLFKAHRRAARLLPNDVHLGPLVSLRFRPIPWELNVLARQLAPEHRTLMEIDGGPAPYRIEVPDPAGFLTAITAQRESCSRDGA